MSGEEGDYCFKHSTLEPCTGCAAEYIAKKTEDDE